MKRRRALIVAAIAVVLLPIVAVGGLVVFFPTERATALAVERLEATTGQRVVVGSSEIRIVPAPRLRLENVGIGTRPEPGKPRITVGSLELGMKLVPLFRRQVEITRLAIDQPLVESIMAEPSETPPPPRETTAGEGADLRIDELVITRGRVAVRSADGRPLFEVIGLEERLSARADRSGSLSLEGTTSVEELVLYLPEGEIGRGLPMRLEKSLAYDAASDELTVARAALDLAGVPISLAGNVTDVSGEQIASLALSGGPGEVESILGFVPHGLVPEIEGMRSRGTLSVSMRVTGSLAAPEGPAFLATLSLTDGRLEYPGVPKPIEAITLNLEATPARVEVTRFTARAAGSSLKAHATITDYKTTPRVALALDARIDLDQVRSFYPAGDSLELAGTVNARLIGEGSTDTPDAFEISGTLESASVRIDAPAMRAPVEALTASAVFDRDRVTITSAKGKLGRSDFALSGVVENPLALDPRQPGNGRARGTFNLTSRLIDLDEMMAPEDPSAPDAERALPELPPLDATVTASIDRLRFRDTDATNLGGRVTLEKDVFRFEEVKGDVFEGRAALEGTFAMKRRKTPSFDLVIDATACDAVDVLTFNRDIGRLATVAQHLTGSMSTKARMKGSLDDTLGLVINSLESDGDVWLQQARLAEHPVQQALATFVKSDALKSLGVEEIIQSFTIQGGRLRFDDLSVAAGEIQAVGSGSSSIDGNYEMALDLWLPRAIAEGARERLPREIVDIFYGGDDDRLMLPVKISGTRNARPSVGLDRDKLSADARARAKARLDAERARLEQEARKRAEEEAKKLLEGAAPDSIPIVEAAKEDVESKVKGALEDLFGR